MIDAGDYLLGAADLAAVAGLCGAAAWLAVRRALPGVEPAPGAVAFGLVFTLAFVGAHVIPLALGILGRGSVLGAAALAAGAALLVPRAAPVAPRPESPQTDRIEGLLAAGAGLLVVAAAVAGAVHHAADASQGLDMVNFHLPDVAAWIQGGTLWDVHQFVPRLTHGNYPNNGDVVLLGATLPWRNDFAARLAMLPWLGLTCGAVYALGRELRAPAGAAVLAAASVAALPVVAESAVEVGLPDTVMWATFAGGLVFLVRHARDGRGADLVLAGIGLGLAFGTKWYGVYGVVAALAAWAAMRLAGGERPRAVIRQLAALSGLAGLAGGIWLLRNWIESGNPVIPLRVAPFGLTIFDAPRDVLREQVGYTISGYVGNGGVWRHQLLPTYRDFLGPAGLALVLGTVAAAAAAVRARREPAGVAVLALCGAALLCAVAYALTPYSAQGGPDLPVFAGPNTRYAIPALLAAAGPAAWLLGRAAARDVWLGRALHALAALAVADGVRRSYEVLDEAPAASLAVVVLGVLAIWVIVPRRLTTSAERPRRSWPLSARPRRLAIAGGLAAAVLALTAAGWHLQKSFNDDRYRGVDATFDWVLDHAPQNRRVALAGDWSHGVGPPFPMFGPRLRNHVAYNGRWVDGRLDYEPDRARFLAALRDGRYDLLVVGRGFEAAPGNPPAHEVREERWARTAGLRPLVRSDTLTLYAVR